MDIFSRITALILVIILAPLFVIVISLNFIFQGLPVFYFHERVGFKYKKFNIIKFRTMKNDQININNITSRNDLRITKWGKFIRFLKIDELPQLWNIIKGDMQFVGPRPEVEEFVNNQDFSFLNSIKPGLTDFSSIILRDEEKVLDNLGGVKHYSELLSIKLELCYLYVKSKSFVLNLKLIILTILSIIFPKTISYLVLKFIIIDINYDLFLQIKKLIK
jgi:lipopolysaccharide/colanic/teichoic acid biosynthesis glycosyltransferase